MPTYRKASAEVNQIVEEMVEKFHGPLRDAGVQIECLFAYALTDDNGDSTGPALKLGGYPCNAVVRVLNLKDRTVGRGDAEIVIDGDQWDTWDDEQKRALIDHEIEHLELKTDDDGVIRDDLGRPKLRLRKHDHQFGWFDSIARRHGAASFEVQQFAGIVKRRIQAWLPGFDMAATDAPEVYDPEAEKDLNSDLRATVEGALDDAGILAKRSSGGIDSVTFTAKYPGRETKSVTMTSKQLGKVAKAAKSGKGRKLAASTR